MQWRFRGIAPADLWRRWRRLPVPEAGEPWPSRIEAVETAFAIFAGTQERMVGDIAEAFAKKASEKGQTAGWQKR